MVFVVGGTVFVVGGTVFVVGGTVFVVDRTVFAMDGAVFATKPPARRLSAAALVTFSLHLGKASAPSGVALYTRAV